MSEQIETTNPWPPAHYPGLLADLAVRLDEGLRKRGMEPARAREVAYETTEQVRKAWGGLMVYVPKGDGFDVTQRDEQIFDEFDGINHEALATKYDLSVQHIYRIIKAVRAARLKKLQRPLF